MENRSAHFKERKTFVERTLRACLETKRTFEAIRYAKDPHTEAEYVRITDVLGGKCYLDITGEPNDRIFNDICRIVIAGEEKIPLPPNYMTDAAKMFEVAHLFRGGVVNE